MDYYVEKVKSRVPDSYMSLGMVLCLDRNDLTVTVLRNTIDHEIYTFHGLDESYQVISGNREGKHANQELFLKLAAKMNEGDSVTFLGATDVGDTEEEAVSTCVMLLKKNISVRFLEPAIVDSNEFVRMGMSAEEICNYFRWTIARIFSLNSQQKMTSVSSGLIKTFNITKKNR